MIEPAGPLEADGFVSATTRGGITEHYESRTIRGKTYIFHGELVTLQDYCELENWRCRIDRILSGEEEEK